MVGKSTPGKDWPFFQPGSANGKDGDRPHPYEIAFNLDGTPRGLYTLKVGLLVENPRLSRLEVEVNGHPALFYQHPQLNYAGGDRPLVVDPIASADTITTDIPTQYLKDGANTLVLTAIDEPSNRDDVIRTGLVYDAVELDHDPGQSFNANNISARAIPTIFYRHNATGLAELVDVYVRNNATSGHGQVVLSIGQSKFIQPLSPVWAFGEQMTEFTVPEFTPGTKGDVAVTAEGHQRQFSLELNPAKKWNVLRRPP